MQSKKLMRVQIGTGTGAQIRVVQEDEAQTLLENQEKVVRYFVEKGFPKEMAENQFAAKLLGPADTQMTTTGSMGL